MEPGPRLKLHPKVGVWRQAPWAAPRHNSAPALALGQARQHPPARGGACSPRHDPAEYKSHLGTGVSVGRGKIHAQGSLYQDEVFKHFLQGEVALHSHAPPPRQDREPPTGIPSRVPPPTIPSPSLYQDGGELTSGLCS